MAGKAGEGALEQRPIGGESLEYCIAYLAQGVSVGLRETGLVAAVAQGVGVFAQQRDLVQFLCLR